MNCKTGTPCEDGILNNISGEGPDFITFFDTYFGTINPKLNNTFTATGCVGTCDSLISQDDANQCAQRQAVLCGNGQVGCAPDDPTCTNGHPTLFYNTPQSCTVYCPDGLPFTYTVPANLYVGDNQDTVNAEAYQFACTQAARLKVCLSSLPRCTCVNTSYSATITATTTSPLTWRFLSGSLPPGLSMTTTASSATIFGTTTTSGTYTFQIEAITSLGTFMTKTYSIVVLSIDVSNLPAYTVGVPYSYQIPVSGGSGNYAFKITIGSLPAGLTMSITGLISGTPT